MSKRDYDRQCSSCGGICRKSGCERANVDPSDLPENIIKRREAVIKILEKSWHDAERESSAWATLARSLAIELECFMLACEDSCAQAKYWQSAHSMLNHYNKEVERLLTDGDPERIAALQGPNRLAV